MMACAWAIKRLWRSRSGGRARRSKPLEGVTAVVTSEVLDRPLTPTSIEIIHWYAARGCSPRKTARDINRPLEIVERVLREMPPPRPGRDNLWPPSYAGWGLA